MDTPVLGLIMRFVVSVASGSIKRFSRKAGSGPSPFGRGRREAPGEGLKTRCNYLTLTRPLGEGPFFATCLTAEAASADSSAREEQTDESDQIQRAGRARQSLRFGL